MSTSNHFDSVWLRVTQALVGLFFTGAAYLKFVDAFFGRATAPLSNDFHYWLDAGFTLSWYRPVLEFLMPYAAIVGIVVIVLQAIVGLLLLFNVGVRWAGLVLIILQTNILLGVYNGWGFIAFVGISIWLGFYYFWKYDLTGRKWMLLSYGLFFLDFVLIKGRYIRGDPWIASFPQKFAHYAQDTISISPALKQLVMWASSGTLGPWLWAAMWWISVAILLMLLTRWRLQAGVLWIIMLTFRYLVWMNGVTSEGVLWILVVLTWLVQEEQWQRKNGIIKLVPGVRDVWGWIQKRIASSG